MLSSILSAPVRLSTFLLASAVVLGCGSKPEPAPPPSPAAQLAGPFRFEPRLGSTFRHTLRRSDRFEIVGSPQRETEESELVIGVTITPEDNLYRYTLRPMSVSIVVNGAPVFAAPDGRVDLSKSGAEVVLLINGEAVVTSIQGAETLTKALVDLAPEERRPVVNQMFAPQVIQQLIIERVVERTADLIGNHSNLGSTWGATPRPGGGYEPVAKQLEVVGDADCSAPRCVTVSRKFQIDQNLIWQAAEAKVKNFVASQGGDPASLKLVSTDVKFQDELVVDPRTLEFHGARFEQSVTIVAQGPKGNVTVQRSSVRTSAYDYGL